MKANVVALCFNANIVVPCPASLPSKKQPPMKEQGMLAVCHPRCRTIYISLILHNESFAGYMSSLHLFLIVRSVPNLCPIVLSAKYNTILM